MPRARALPEITRRFAPGRAASRPQWALVGLALLLLGVGAIVVSTSFDTPVESKPLGVNIPVNEGASDPADISSNNSPTLVRSPVNARNLAVANRIDSPRYSCALHVSFDAGATWRQTAIPAPAGERLCYAPDVAFGADGALYVSFVTLRGRGNVPNAAWISRSGDGGRTLSRPVKAITGHAFQVRLVTDPTAPRRLYLTWLQASGLGLYKFTDIGNPIRAMRSDDGGRTWQPPARVSRASRARVVAPSPAIGPEGQVYVLYLDLGQDRTDYEGLHRGRGGPPYPESWQLVLARSTDRGRGWEESVVEKRLLPTRRFIVFTPPFPSLAVDRSSGRLYAGFEDRRLGDPDVWVWSLPRGGTRWEGPTRVNDTPAQDRTAQYLPKLAVAPNGRLDVVYYDRRADPRNILNQVSLQSSTNHGHSFGRRARLSDRAFSSKIGAGSERGLPDLGSRLGLVSTNSRSYAVWTDTRAGTRLSGKQDIARSVVAFSDPPRLSDPVKYLLRFGGIVLALLGALVIGGWAASGGVAVLRRRGW